MEYSNLLDERVRNTPRARRLDSLTFFLILMTVMVMVIYLHQEPATSCEPLLPMTNTETTTKTTESTLEYHGVVESMDGVGFNYESAKNNMTPFEKYFELENSLAPCDLSVDKPTPHNDVEKLVKGFHDCIDPILESLEKQGIEGFSDNFTAATEKCDKIPEFENLRIEGFWNQHEIKWAILPNCKEPNTMVTMGIGHDVNAEETLKRTLPETTFYGADPIIEPNLQLYSAFGKFFPFAIGKEAGVQNFKVLPNQNQKTRTYSRQDVTTIDISYFLHNILNLRQIDFLWIDIEGGELLFMDELNKGKKLDEHGISICQFNIELHPDYWKDGYQLTYEFISAIRRDNRFIFLKPMLTGKGVFRLFFINIEDKRCVRKYLQ